MFNKSSTSAGLRPRRVISAKFADSSHKEKQERRGEGGTKKDEEAIVLSVVLRSNLLR